MKGGNTEMIGFSPSYLEGNQIQFIMCSDLGQAR